MICKPKRDKPERYLPLQAARWGHLPISCRVGSPPRTLFNRTKACLFPSCSSITQLGRLKSKMSDSVILGVIAQVTENWRLCAVTLVAAPLVLNLLRSLYTYQVCIPRTTGAPATDRLNSFRQIDSAIGRRHDCQLAPELPKRWPLGIDRIRLGRKRRRPAVSLLLQSCGRLRAAQHRFAILSYRTTRIQHVAPRQCRSRPVLELSR